MNQSKNVKYQQATKQRKGVPTSSLNVNKGAKTGQAIKLNKPGNKQGGIRLDAFKKVARPETEMKDPVSLIIYNKLFDVFASYFEINKIKQEDIDNMSPEQLRNYVDQLLLRNQELQVYLSRLEDWSTKFAVKEPTANKSSFINFPSKPVTSRNGKKPFPAKAPAATQNKRQVLLSPNKKPAGNKLVVKKSTTKKPTKK